MADATAELTRLLVRWRAARLERTSALIHRVGELVDFTPPPLPKKSKRAAVAEWLDATQREGPATLSARLTQLVPWLAEASAASTWPLFEALVARPADPRLATLAARALTRDVQVDLKSARLARRLLNCVERHGDVGHWRALELMSRRVLSGDGRGRFERLLKAGLDARPEGPELSDGECAALVTQKWEVGVAEVAPDLFAHVYEAPADRARRQVLADALQEAGEPRGEFIALQLAQEGEARQQALLKAHRKAWLGPFASSVEAAGCHFEGGFVSELAFKPLRATKFNTFARAPEWATVRRVRGRLPWLTAQMKSLEDAGNLDGDALRAYHRAALRLPLTTLLVDLSAEAGRVDLPGLLLTLPGLRHLDLMVRGRANLEATFAAPWPALTSLGLWPGDDGFPALELALGASRFDAVALHLPFGGALTLRREVKGFELVVEDAPRVPPELLSRALEAGPVRVVAAGRLRPEHEASLRALTSSRGLALER